MELLQDCLSNIWITYIRLYTPVITTVFTWLNTAPWKIATVDQHHKWYANSKYGASIMQIKVIAKFQAFIQVNMVFALNHANMWPSEPNSHFQFYHFSAS